MNFLCGQAWFLVVLGLSYIVGSLKAQGEEIWMGNLWVGWVLRGEEFVVLQHPRLQVPLLKWKAEC